MSSNITCYAPDGTASIGNYPCGFPNLSTCCGYGWDCLDNGLCRQHGTTGYSQGTCTDPSYQNCLSFCNQPQFDGFGEVSRCKLNGNSWCCGGAAGQGLGGTNCCDTDRTTSLAPYPFSAIENTGQPVAAQSTTSSTSEFEVTRIVLTSSTSDGTPQQKTITLTSTSSNSITTSSLVTSVIIPGSSRSSSLMTSQSSSQTPIATSAQVLATPSKTSASSSLPQSTNQGHNSKTGIEVGIPVAIVVVLLVILAFFVLQNRKFKRRLLQLRGQTEEGSLERKGPLYEMHEREGTVMGELDLTHYELAQRDAPKHEVLGNGVYELYHNGISEHELAGDSPSR